MKRLFSVLAATAVVAGLLAAVGVADVSQSVAQASSSPGLTWTKRHPATHPAARCCAAMAYDAATGTVVMFGGQGGLHGGHALGGTWTWDGSIWTQQHPATSPPTAAFGAMAYDAANGTVVLYLGGVGFSDTWTWDGSTWTQQAPATSPPGRQYAAMAYDAATGTVVLFGGQGRHGGRPNGGALADTWTWDGSTWARQALTPSPHARIQPAMAYNAANGTVVLFGGQNSARHLGGSTWVWDGSTWTQQTPATHPSARFGAAMAYDAATRTVVLFGGYGLYGGGYLGDTWTWAPTEARPNVA